MWERHPLRVIDAAGLRCKPRVEEKLEQLSVGDALLTIRFFSSRRRHTRLQGDWSSDVCSSDLELRDRLVEKDWKLFDDLQYLEVNGADHSEGAWAARVDPALRFLYPPVPPDKIDKNKIGRASCRERV